MSPSENAPFVLVVDDEAIIAMHVAMVMEDDGRWRCGVAASVKQAVRIASSQPPDAAVVDIRLGPGPDGIELGKELKARYGTALVFLSGSGEPETVARALSVDGAVFLQKPADPDTLIRAVAGALSGR